MDNPIIETPREPPPVWVRPTQHGGPANAATERQVAFIRGLQRQKELTTEQDDWLNKRLAEFLSKSGASEIIDRLLKLPNKSDATIHQPGLPEVPAGRYAVEANDGELRFYKVWIGRNGYVKLYVLHGPDETQMNYKTSITIMRKILDAGVRQCAIRYGLEIGSCSNCGRRLTNRISRELGIGPVCGGRMFGDDFKTEVRSKRDEIAARGEDPDEELA